MSALAGIDIALWDLKGEKWDPFGNFPPIKLICINPFE